MTSGPSIPALTIAFTVALGTIAWLSPDPNRVTDRDVYERAAAEVIVPDCTDLHCFRALVPWVIGRVPGPSQLRWKAYAAVCNAAAAVAVFMLTLRLGASRRVATLASALSAFGFGSLYTLHDPFTADPLMYAIGPAVTEALFAGRLGIAAAMGVVGVFAKEFAAAPLYAYMAFAAVERRWTASLRALAAANCAFLAWAAFTIALMLRFNYGWGANGAASGNLLGGAELVVWAEHQTARGMASAMFNEFGALYVLAPVGYFLASARLRRLALASLPIAALFAYVQQPDRALWNFHYLATPFAALTLEQTSARIAWTTVALFAIGNLRVGAQLPIAPFSHVAIAASLVLALVSAATAAKSLRIAPPHALAVGAGGK
jgi:hypothetical protein